jgi:hypothetical protein
MTEGEADLTTARKAITAPDAPEAEAEEAAAEVAIALFIEGSTANFAARKPR